MEDGSENFVQENHAETAHLNHSELRSSEPQNEPAKAEESAVQMTTIAAELRALLYTQNQTVESRFESSSVTTIQKLESQYPAELAELRQKFDAELQSLQAKHRADLDELEKAQRERDQDAADEQARLQDVINDLRKDQKTRAEIFDRKRKEIQRRYESKVGDNQAALSDIKRAEAMDRSLKLVGFIKAAEYMIEQINSIIQHQKLSLPLNPGCFKSLMKLCDGCGYHVGAGDYYVCETCRGPELGGPFELCRWCYNDSDRRCYDDTHSLTKTTLVDEMSTSCARALNGRGYKMGCYHCHKDCKLIFFHCCDCKIGPDGGSCELTICPACVLLKRRCKSKQHLLKMGAAPY